MRNIMGLLSLASLILISFSCGSGGGASYGAEYDESLDDIVMGVYFGMERKDFLDHCWELNQEGKTRHGTIGNMVMYVDSLNFTPKVVTNFYPKFEENVISEMPFIFYFNAWAPWNMDELKQEDLYQQVIKYFEHKYEISLERKDAPNGKHLHYNRVGPLMVRVFKDKDEMKVHADVRNFAYIQKEEE